MAVIADHGGVGREKIDRLSGTGPEGGKIQDY